MRRYTQSEMRKFVVFFIVILISFTTQAEKVHTLFSGHYTPSSAISEIKSVIVDVKYMPYSEWDRCPFDNHGVADVMIRTLENSGFEVFDARKTNFLDIPEDVTYFDLVSEIHWDINPVEEVNRAFITCVNFFHLNIYREEHYSVAKYDYSPREIIWDYYALTFAETKQQQVDRVFSTVDGLVKNFLENYLKEIKK
jgi:hypothetical protein